MTDSGKQQKKEQLIRDILCEVIQLRDEDERNSHHVDLEEGSP